MNDAAANANAYLRTRVMSARPEELRLMLIEAAIRFATQAKEGLERKDFEASYLGFGQCRDIVTELMTTAKSDEAPELAEKIRALYAFLYSELVDASFGRDTAKVSKVIELLEFEAETWRLACEKLKAERATGLIDGPPAANPTANPAANPTANPRAASAGRAPLSIQA